MSRDARIDELLAEWERQRMGGVSLAPEQLAPDEPEHWDGLGRRIQGVLALDAEFGLGAEPGLPRGTRGGGQSHCPDANGTSEDEPEQEYHTSARYLRHDLHAEGGLGRVYRAEDMQLGRAVVLKVMKARHPDERSKQRFLHEARVTGRLEHPGIPPVYTRGEDAKGRPFYIMRLLPGRTLQESLRALHAGGGGPTLFIGRAFRELLTRFVTVCKTVAFAHEQQVAHLDLKPENIMQGGFGETMVVDWGLARPVEEGPVSEPPAASAPPLPGTPAYMSPEQALGQEDRVGPGSDIYSLGATLYAILTGQRPYRGRDSFEVIAKVRKEPPPPPRTVNAGIPRALEAVCQKAMAREPEDRYESALALAEDLERWLADEPVSACQDSFSVRAGRWLRRHRTFAVSAGAAAAVLVAALGVGLGLAGWFNRRLEAANTQLTSANDRLSEANKKLARANAELAAAREKAEREKAIAQAVRGFLQFDLLRQADPKAQADRLLRMGGEGFGVQENPTIRDLLDRAAQELTKDKIDKKFPDQPRVQAEILRAVGDSYRAVGEYERSIAHLERSRRLFATAHGKDHPATLAAQNSLALTYLVAGKVTEAVSLYEENLKATKAKLGPDHPDTLASQGNLAGAYLNAGKLKEAAPLLEQTLKARQAKLGPDHPSTLNAQNILAWAYYRAGRFDEAIPLFEQTLKARRAKLGPDHPDTLTTQANLAVAYQIAGRLDEAIRLLERTIKAQRAKVGPDVPDTLGTQNNLAEAYAAAKQLDKAVPLFEQTLQAQKAKLGPDHPATLTTQNNLACAYRDVGRLKEAISLFEQTLKGRKAKLGPDHPDTLQSQNNLASAYQAAGRPEEAIPLLEQTLRGFKAKRGADHPDTLITQSNLAGAYRAAGRLKEAIPLYEQALKGFQAKLGPAHPNTLTIQGNLMSAYGGAGQFDKLEGLLRERLALLTEKVPASWQTAQTRSLLGEALARQKKYAEAEKLLLAGHEALTEHVGDIPAKYRTQRLADSAQRLVDLYMAWGKPAEAQKWRKVLDEAKAKTEKEKPPRP